jgi:hypothetical protein
VEQFTGEGLPLEVRLSDRVEDVKRMIAEGVGAAVDRQHLLFGGQTLGNESTCQDCRIRDGSVMHLIVRPAPSDQGRFVAVKAPDERDSGLNAPDESED